MREAGILPKSGCMGDKLAPRADIGRLAESFFAGLDPLTQDVYRRSLWRFSEFIGVKTPTELAKSLFAGGQGPANQAVLDYRNHLKNDGKAPATVNQHLAAIRSFVTFARTIGLVVWKLEVKGLSVQALRDTRGPGKDGVGKLLAAAAAQEAPWSLRDVAIVRLMWDLGLRRREVAKLDVSDVNLDQGIVWILGKKRLEKEKMTLAPETSAAIRAWIGERRSGPLFVKISKGKKLLVDRRLTGKGIWDIVAYLGNQCGFKAWPHGVRHAAVTCVLDATNGNVRAAQRFSRHKSMDMVMRYDDNREDLAGDMTKLIAREVGQPKTNGNGRRHMAA